MLNTEKRRWQILEEINALKSELEWLDNNLEKDINGVKFIYDGYFMRILLDDKLNFNRFCRKQIRDFILECDIVDCKLNEEKKKDFCQKVRIAGNLVAKNDNVVWHDTTKIIDDIEDAKKLINFLYEYIILES